MNAVLSIVRREIHAYFVSPIAYTVTIIFLLISTFGFVKGILQFSMLPPFLVEERALNIRNFIFGDLSTWINVGMMLCLPALSMRQLAEERRQGTAELLLTSPLSTVQLVVGKYLAAVIVFLLMLLLTLPFSGILEWQATPEWPAIGTMYLSLFLCGCVILSVGLFTSSLTENQIVALLLTYAIWLPFWLVELAVGFMGGIVDDILAGISVGISLQLMGQGLVDTHFLVLDGALIFLFLFLCVQVLESSRWR